VRLKLKVRDYYGGWPKHDDQKERVVGILAHTRTVCSCWMCGTPRRYQHQLSFTELRFHGRSRRWSNKPLQPTRAASLLGQQETPVFGPRG
jgi:hypothetical protein